MTVISIFVICAFTLYAYIAVLSITLQPRTRSHWLLFTAAVCAAFWTFFSYFAYNADTLAELRRWVHVSVSGMFMFFPVHLLFIISVVPGRTVTPFLSAIVVLPGLALFILNFFCPFVFSDFYLGAKGWVFVPAIGNPLNIVWMMYVVICFSTGVLLLFSWRKKTALVRERKQIGVLAATQIAAEVLILLEYQLHDILIYIRPATISPVLLIIWLIGMIIAMKRYRLLSITPESVSGELLNSIDEVIILLDKDRRVAYMNTKAISLFGAPFRKLENTKLPELAVESHNDGPLVPAKEAVLHLSVPGRKQRTIDAEVSRLNDRFGDPLGFLFVGNERDGTQLKEERLATVFGCTPREARIAAMLLNDKTIRQISTGLGISIKTVKNHITRIYKKTETVNRVELYNRVRSG
jgi:DNA-binding CsgD family transcriptional regulator/PAS domain-containing protein